MEKMIYIYKKIELLTNLKITLILLFITFSMMFFVNFIDSPVGVTRINSIAPNVGILDFLTYYNSNTAYSLLENLTQEGRKTYLNLLIFFDFIFPMVYSISFSSLILLILKNTLKKENKLNILAITPIFIGFFDILENLSIINMILNFPERIFIANFAGYFTLGKQIFSVLSVGLIFFSLIFLVISKKD
ncbi:MAG: hypothetical protein U0457_10445 [Candidatus Sericytochromatia bacterium]